MSFKEVASLDADVTTALGGKNKKTGKKNPTSIEGYYLGTRKVESKKGKNGLSCIHFIQTSEGNVGVWGKTDLDRKIASVTPGSMVRISHTGMQSTPNGDMYKFKVEVDEDNAIEVASVSDNNEERNASSSNEDEENDSSEDDEDSEDTEDSEDEEDSVQLAAAAKSAAERKAKVQGLLNKGKKA